MTPDERALEVWKELVGIEPPEAATGGAMILLIANTIRGAIAEDREKRGAICPHSALGDCAADRMVEERDRLREDARQAWATAHATEGTAAEAILGRER